MDIAAINEAIAKKADTQKATNMLEYISNRNFLLKVNFIAKNKIKQNYKKISKQTFSNQGCVFLVIWSDFNFSLMGWQIMDPNVSTGDQVLTHKIS